MEHTNASATYAERQWLAIARMGFRYDSRATAFVRDAYSYPVPRSERRAAARISRQVEREQRAGRATRQDLGGAL